MDHDLIDPQRGEGFQQTGNFQRARIPRIKTKVSAPSIKA
jgi:hypothetical protein